MQSWSEIGSVLFGLAAFSVMVLPRLLHFGAYFNAVPYLIIVIGTALFMLDRPSDGIWVGLIFLVLTGLLHAGVLYDIRRDWKNTTE